MVLMTTTTTAPATPKQIAFLKRLCAERPMWRMVENLHDDVIERMTKKVASQFIDEALSLPKEGPATPEAEAQRPEVPAVIHHLLGGQIYRVVISRQGGGRYAKALHFDTTTDERWWTYEGKAPLALLSIDTVMTLEQMAEHGHHTGFCIRCSAELSDPISVKRGLGPDCIKKATKELRALGLLV